MSNLRMRHEPQDHETCTTIACYPKPSLRTYTTIAADTEIAITDSGDSNLISTKFNWV